MLSSFTTNETVKQIMDYIKPYKEKLKKLYKQNKYLRIISITGFSITTSWIIRNIYVKMWRKYKNLPDGPYGYPLLGHITLLINPFWAATLSKYGAVTSIQMGPTISVISFQNPYLIKKIYSDNRTLDVLETFDSDTMFISTNGHEWEKRRKIVYANLMSTLKASFVEDASIAFMKNKVFPVFDQKIKNNQNIECKEYFRALGFNAINQACFGSELDSLDDPFMQNFFDQIAKLNKSRALKTILLFILGGESKVTETIFRCFGLQPFAEIFDNLQRIMEDFANDDSKKLKTNDNDQNLKLFNSYIQDYNNEDNKLSKRKLFGDMALMFAASTDTTFGALSFSMLLAAKNPSIQDEIYQELIAAFGNDVSNITLSKGGILKIPKLRAFIHEAMRIYPPAGLAGFREIKSKGFTIDTRPYGGHKVYNADPGICIMMNIISVHHNPEYWIKDFDRENNPDHKSIDMKKIHMEFWLDKDGKFNKQQNSHLFLAFSRGKRDCVGQALAMKQLYIVLAMMFMKYRVSGPNGDNNFGIGARLSSVVEPVPNVVRLQLR